MSHCSILDGRGDVAVETGAGSAIGRATAVAFAEAGAQVPGVGRREGLLKETAALHRGIDILAIDVCGEGTPAEEIRTAVQRWGRIDHLIDNAGATSPAPMGTDPWRETHATRPARPPSNR